MKKQNLIQIFYFKKDVYAKISNPNPKIRNPLKFQESEILGKSGVFFNGFLIESASDPKIRRIATPGWKIRTTFITLIFNRFLFISIKFLKITNWKLGSGALNGKMLLVRNIENDKIDSYCKSGLVKLRLNLPCWVRKGIKIVPVGARKKLG